MSNVKENKGNARKLAKYVLNNYLFVINNSNEKKYKRLHIGAIVIIIILTFIIFYLSKPGINELIVIAKVNVSLAALAFILYAMIFVQHYNETREAIITLYYREERYPLEMDANGRRVLEQYEATEEDKRFLLGNGIFIIIALFVSAILGIFSITFYKFYLVSLIIEIFAIIIIELAFLVISILLLNMVTDTIYVEYPKSMNVWKNKKKKDN